jgi:hypothetical protein
MTQEELKQKRVDLGLVDPGNLNRYYMYYKKDALQQFLNNIPKYDLPVTKTETVYVETKSISQSKLREVGFKITRSKENATFIIVDSFLAPIDDMGSMGWGSGNIFRFNNRTKAEDFIDNRLIDLDKDYSYLTVENIYKHIYKYEGNLELYTSIKDLIASNVVSNTTMAMEFMSNANWEDNKVYLMDIFSNYSEIIYHNPYRNSISFKGFSESLVFNFRSVNLRDADDYRPYCSSEEHHQFVFKKFEDSFKTRLADLIKQYKIQVDEFKYSIDYNTVEETEC